MANSPILLGIIDGLWARVGPYFNLQIFNKEHLDEFFILHMEMCEALKQKELWLVEVDRSQIEQVLLNIYVNAWQAMPDGGNLYIQTNNVILDEYLVSGYGARPGKFAEISITDTGIGIDEKTSEKVFDPFFTTKEKERGTGLGLASAYGIIKNHGGIIKVESEKGKGTTFTIYIPASDCYFRSDYAGDGRWRDL